MTPEERVLGQVIGAGRGMLATPEDPILAKLEWARIGGESQKQLSDVAGIVDVKGPDLDRDYVERWARTLGVLDLWRRIARGRRAV